PLPCSSHWPGRSSPMASTTTSATPQDTLHGRRPDSCTGKEVDVASSERRLRPAAVVSLRSNRTVNLGELTLVPQYKEKVCRTNIRAVFSCMISTVGFAFRQVN